MKILMLGWELPPYNSGGLGVACYQLAKALAEHGADIHFVLPSTANHEPASFMTISSPAGTRHVPAAAAPLAYSADYEAVRDLQREYEHYAEAVALEHAPHVIHAHDWLTLGAGVRAKERSGAPLIAHVHATEYDRAGGGTGNPLIHEIEQNGLLMADHIVAVSHTTKRLIMEKYHIPEDKIEVIHNSAEYLPEHTTDLMEYRYVEQLKREGYTIVATVGRLTVQKGLVHFLRAAALAHNRHARFLFVISGDGEQRNELIELSADLGISDAVLFTGFVRGAAWRDIFNLADVFVMSSISEPFGLTALEAAQHYTAISLTNQSGVREVLSNALHYDYWDEQRLADQLVALALSHPLRQTLATNALHEVRRLSWRDVAKKFTTRYEKLGAITA